MSGAEQQRPRHLGILVRRLREAGGLTRRELAALAKLADVDVRNVEAGRRRPTRGVLERIIAAPGIAAPLAWRGLVALAEREGIPLDLAPEPSAARGS